MARKNFFYDKQIFIIQKRIQQEMGKDEVGTQQ